MGLYQLLHSKKDISGLWFVTLLYLKQTTNKDLLQKKKKVNKNKHTGDKVEMKND